MDEIFLNKSAKCSKPKETGCTIKKIILWPIFDKDVTFLLIYDQSAKVQFLVTVTLINFFSEQFYTKKIIKGHSVTYCILLQMIKQ